MSPYKVLFGHLAKTPFYLVWSRMKDKQNREMNLSTWVNDQCEHLNINILRVSAYEGFGSASENRKCIYDKGKVTE